MDTPHKCPVCNGTGLVSIPPDLPGDQLTYTSASIRSYECKACTGSGIVWELVTEEPFIASNPYIDFELEKMKARKKKRPFPIEFHDKMTPEEWDEQEKRRCW